MTKEIFLTKWATDCAMVVDLEAVIATEIEKVKEAKPEEPKGNCSTFDMSRLVEQEQPELNPIAEAYERGEKIRHKNWLNGDWIQKYKETKTIDNHGNINSVYPFAFIQHPEKWELYTEPTEQLAKPMTYDEALKHILASKLTHKNAGNDSWYAYQYFAKRIHFCDENGKDMIWVRFDELDLTEWYPCKKPFDKDRFEAMFRAVVASGRTGAWEQDFKFTEEALAQLDAYYAKKEKGGNNE